MEESISLKELFLVFKKRLTMIISITFAAVLISAIASFFFMNPVYQSSTQILVNQKKQQGGVITSSDVVTNLQLVNTYTGIIKSPAILDKVIQNLSLNMSTDQLNGKVTVASQKDSQIFSVTVRDGNPKKAQEIANNIADVFKQEIPSIMSVDNTTILSKAVEEKSPIKPRPSVNIMIAFVVGLMASVGLAFLLEYLDNTIKKERDVEAILGLPVLGVIAQMEEKKLVEKVRASHSHSKAREHTIGS